jgi:subtilisin family serine protease
VATIVAALTALAPPAGAQTADPDPTTPTPAPSPAPAPVTPPYEPAPWQLRNLETYQPWRVMIGMPAYGLPPAGNGVVLGMADTGLDITHSALRGQMLVGWDATTGTADVTDLNGHGTHVGALMAGTLANGAALGGLAPGAKLAVAKVFSDSGTTSSTAVESGINWLVDVVKAPIVNLSLGASSPVLVDAMRNAAAKGTLMVVAAGNDGAADPGWPARYASREWAMGRIIVVGALDTDGTLAPYSNRAGTTAAYYVVAPGTQVVSAYPGELYAYMSGTSMATPIVSGQAALIKSAWPYLSAERIAQVIFRTATDLGAPGVDAVYGWGIVNVARSLGPVGALIVAVDGKPPVDINASATATSRAPVTMGTTGGGATVRSQAFDELGRNFTVKAGAALAPSTPLTLESVFGPTDRMLSAASATIARGVKMTAVTDAPRLESLGSAYDPYHAPYPTMRAMTLTLAQETPEGTNLLAAGTGGLGYTAFSVPASDIGLHLQGAEFALASPLLKLAGNHNFVAYGHALGDGWLLRAGGVSSFTPALAEQGSLGLIEVVKQGGDYLLSLDYSALSQPTVLGATQPLLGFAQASRTQALSVTAARRLAWDFAVAGAFHVAQTDGLHAGGAGSLFEGSTATRATGFGVAAVWSALASDDDRFSVTLSSPLRADSGTLRYSVISAVDPQTGIPTSGVQDVPARPNGREKLAELRYTRPLKGRSAIAFSLAGRFEPDHNADARTQSMVAVRYTAAF